MNGDSKFFPGLHQPSDARHFACACISISRLRGRKKPLGPVQVLVDSGAFKELELFGRYRHGVEEYAAELLRLSRDGVVNILAAVAQDYMCEPFMLARTGLTIADHQRLTIERYDALVVALGPDCPFPVMPVLQGYAPEDYVRHLEAYGDRLKPGMWVGIGSVCKRNGRPQKIANVVRPLKNARPDLRFHGFGVKITAVQHPTVHRLFSTYDSMAWSAAARFAKDKKGRNDWRAARAYADRIGAMIDRPLDPYVPDLLEPV